MILQPYLQWVSLEVPLLSVSRESECVAVTRKGKPPTPTSSTECVCVCVCSVLPVKGSAGRHAPGKAFDALLSEEGDGGEIGGHDGQ